MSSVVEQWLRLNVGGYDERGRVHADVEAALARFPALRPKSDVYTYDDGRTQLLVCLHGLIPISFRGSSYNIPISIWITKDYPRRPPISYVVPTNDMLIRQSTVVDLSGRCTLSYTTDWLKKPEACNIADLLSAMQLYFSRFPPLYAKPRPPLPPKPTHTHYPQFIRPPPPLPRAETQPPQYHPFGNISRSSIEQSRDPPVSPNFRTSIPPTTLPYPFVQSPPPHASISPPTHHVPLLPRPNLLDDDAPPTQPLSPLAPPRPPNPELLHLHAQLHDKIQSEFASLSQLIRLETDRLRAHQSDLLAGEPAIRDEMARLEAVRDVCRNVAARLQSSIDNAQHNLADLRRKGDPDVDELLCSTSIVHNQLINLVAEDNAIEDTIYHLHRALNTGRIDLERFLRTTRVLAEEQFMKRALIDKIQLGLPMGITSPYS